MLSEVFPIPAALGATESIVTAAASFIVAVFLSWASIVLYYHKSKWRPLDTLIFLLLLECILKQAIAVLYSCLVLLQPAQTASWCPAVIWLTAASHTLQASTVTTLSLSVLLRVRMPSVKYRETLSKSHVVYHCGCLFLLSGCVGVAAILAQTRNDACVPHHDKRYLVFYLTLHSSLILCSVISLIYSCSCRRTHNTTTTNTICSSSCSTGLHSKQLLLNSSSDISSALSDISMISAKSKSSPAVAVSGGNGVGGSIAASSSSARVSYSVSNCSGCRFKNSLVEKLLLENPPPQHRFKAQRVNSYLTSAVRPDPVHRFTTKGMTVASAATDKSELNETHFLCCDTADNSTYARMYHHQEQRGSGKTIGYNSTCDTSSSSSNGRSIGRSGCYFNHRLLIPEDICLATISAIICMTYLVDHIPVLASTLIMISAPQYLPVNWPYKTFPLWAALAEGCLMPIVLFMFDDQFASRVSSLYASSSSSEKGVYGKFRAYNSTLSDGSPTDGETVRFPLTNGSLFTGLDGLPSVHIHRRPRGVCKNNFIAPSPILLNSSKRPWYLINEPPKNLTSSAEIRPFAVAATSSPSARQNIYADDTRNSHHPIGSRRLVQNSSNRHSTTKLDTFDHPEAHQTSENIRQQLRNTIFSSSNNQQFDSEYECDSSAEEPVYATLSAYSTYSATTTANDDFEFFRHIAIPDTASQHRINNHRTEEMPYQKYNNDTQDDPCIISKHQVLSRKTSPITRLDYVMEQKANIAQHNKSKRNQYIKEELDYREMSWCQNLDSARESKLRHSVQPVQRIKLPVATPVLQKKSAMSMLSVDSLVNALNDAHMSYLDTGDLCKHSSQCHASSVPDLKKIFITDFL